MGLIFVVTCPSILWYKILSKTRVIIDLCYELILIHNGKFGQEHVNYQNLFINSSVICRVNLSWVFSYCFLSSYIQCLFLLFLLFFLYEPSSYVILVHLDNFWPYWALLSWFFIMKWDFWGLPYCSGVHLDNF